MDGVRDTEDWEGGRVNNYDLAKGRTMQLSGARFYVLLPDTKQPSRALTGPSFEIAFPGYKVLNCGWE